MIRLIVSVFAVLVTSAAIGQSVAAMGLKVAPLEYKTSLAENEQKKGFVDVSNPSSQAVNINVTVQAFRQIDDDGGLQFYDDKQVSLGIIPELRVVDLGPREALRLFFTIDGKQLPEGDVYAALFFTTQPAQAQNGVGQAVRVGTLFSLVNKSPGPRTAEITGLNFPWFQLSDTVTGEYRIKNTSRTGSGFYPTVQISAWPGTVKSDSESSLVFSGRERSNDVSLKTGFGIHRINVAYGDSVKSQWIIAVAPWMVVLTLLVVLIVVIELILLKKRRKSATKSQPETPRSTL